MDTVFRRPTSLLGTSYKLKVRGWKKIFHANEDQKKAGVAILISDKIDLKMKNFFSLPFPEPLPQHMEVPRLGV